MNSWKIAPHFPGLEVNRNGEIRTTHEDQPIIIAWHMDAKQNPVARYLVWVRGHRSELVRVAEIVADAWLSKPYPDSKLYRFETTGTERDDRPENLFYSTTYPFSKKVSQVPKEVIAQNVQADLERIRQEFAGESCIRVRDLTKALGLPKATASHRLSQMVALGELTRLPRNHGFIWKKKN